MARGHSVPATGRPFSGVIIIDAEHIGLPVGVQAGIGGAPYASHAEDDRSHPQDVERTLLGDKFI